MSTLSKLTHYFIITLIFYAIITPVWGAINAAHTEAIAAAAPKTMRQGQVTWIYDGDTLQIQGMGTVRLLGIDCPEKIESDRDWKYLKMGCQNRAKLRSSAADTIHRVIKLCKGKQVQIQLAGDKKDKYGRTLAYVWLPDGRMLNRIMLQEGRAIVYRRFDFSHKDNFLELENKAMNQRRGIWHGRRITATRQ
jgi:micrococcal nuclease